MKMQTIVGVVVLGAVFLSSTELAMAHVVVRPNEVKVAAFQTFTMGVPNEKDLPTVAVRLVIPEGLKHLSPNVKPGWDISVKKTGEGEAAKITEVSWRGGIIPAGQRDDFFFSAQVPPEAGVLNWKAYQTYQDGTVVPWDQDPNAPKPSVVPGEDKPGMNPYSMTKVVNDQTVASQTPGANGQLKGSWDTTMIFSIAALLLSCAAIGIALRKK